MKFALLRLELIWALSIVAGCTHFVPPKPWDASDAIKQRTRITGSSAYQNHPETLVGRIISVKKNASGTCDLANRVFDTWTLSRTAYTKASQPSPEQKPIVIYQKTVAGSISANGTFPFVSVNAGGDGAVELVITDLAESIGGPNIDQSAVDAVVAAPWPPEVCARFLIENVVSSLALYKIHSKVTSKTNIAGVAFGIGNEVYSSDEEFKPEALIFADLNPLERTGYRVLQPNEKRPTLQLMLAPNASYQMEDLK